MMKTKDKLLAILIEKKNEWVSGELIGNSLEISRAAVWKAAMSLRNEGYLIDAAQNKGYRLVEDADVLSELGILKYLNNDSKMLDIHIIPAASSTNSLLWEKEKSGAPEGTVIIAGMQTNGKGRSGRKFYSPADTGIYMSILLRPVHEKPDQAMRITTLAAVAACETFEAATGKIAYIKWVNDVFMENRKVCGILTEGSYNLETGNLEAVVLGIGINVYSPEGGFPADIESTAGPVFTENRADGKNILAAGFLNRLMKYYLSSDSESYVSKYRERCFVIGKQVLVVLGNETRNAYVRNVDDNCRLVVEYENGCIDSLSAGEIRIIL